MAWIKLRSSFSHSFLRQKCLYLAICDKKLALFIKENFFTLLRSLKSCLGWVDQKSLIGFWPHPSLFPMTTINSTGYTKYFWCVLTCILANEAKNWYVCMNFQLIIFMSDKEVEHLCIKLHMILSAMNFQICLLLGLLICPYAISKVKHKSKYDSSEIKEKDGKGNLPFKGSQVSFYIHIT